MALTAYVRHLMEVSYFKYLGRVLLVSDDELTAVIRNLQ